MNTPQAYEPVLPKKIKAWLAEKKAAAENIDIRTKLPECPLTYEVPYIPNKHTALVISLGFDDIHWQEKMLPWTLASLINNTDLIVDGIHIYIYYRRQNQDRVRAALANFEFSPEYDPVLPWGSGSSTKLIDSYKQYVSYDINDWAFRDASNQHKMDTATVFQWLTQAGDPPIPAYPDIDVVSSAPQIYDMSDCTEQQFRHAMKNLQAAHLGFIL